jgi:hypothetical protein
MGLGRWGAGAVLGAAAMLVAGCGLLSPSHSYRYRVTVEVDTPQGLRTGSSVWETKAWEGIGIPDRGIRSRERGEAVAVDLPGGTLFALLQGADMDVDYASGVVVGHLRAHPVPGIAMGKDWKENRRLIAKVKPAFELYPEEYPLLVRFRDISDPASVEKIHPNLVASSFGAGVHLKRITIAVTNGNVTTGILDKLQWLAKQRGALAKDQCEDVRNMPLSCQVTDSDFRTGLN